MSDSRQRVDAATIATRVRVVDACVQPMVKDPVDLARYMRDPWRQLPLAVPTDIDYVQPAPLYISAEDGGGLPGSDREEVIARAKTNGVDTTILVPRTRGLLPDIEHSSEVARATNLWLADDWLRGDGHDFRGTIRIEPRDVRAAVEEIELWANDERFVQVGVAMQAIAPLGQRPYWPIWEACATAGLPVVVSADATHHGIEFPTTAVGTPPYQIQKEVLAPSTFAYHLASFLAEGVLERHPTLIFVFADGGIDLLMPLAWRMDKDWRSQHPEVPWIRQTPLDYLDNFRFMTDGTAGAGHSEAWTFWLEVASASARLMYGSRFPAWNTLLPDGVRSSLPAGWSEAVLGGNAAALYQL